jgi:hypothetical protein
MSAAVVRRKNRDRSPSTLNRQVCKLCTPAEHAAADPSGMPSYGDRTPGKRPSSATLVQICRSKLTVVGESYLPC